MNNSYLNLWIDFNKLNYVWLLLYLFSENQWQSIDIGLVQNKISKWVDLDILFCISLFKVY